MGGRPRRIPVCGPGHADASARSHRGRTATSDGRFTSPPAVGPVENFKICPSGLSGVASDETSCAFADSVRSSWYSQPGVSVIAYSPVTHQSYVMTCAPATTNVWPGTKRCSGVNAQGTILIVYIN